MENIITQPGDSRTENVAAQIKNETINQSGNIFLVNFKFLMAGIIFGILLIKGEVVSWFRIQEMFRFQSFHMYGIIGSAVMTGMISIFLIKKLRLKTINKEEIVIRPKKFHKGYVYGGLIFGFGWAI